MIILIFQPICYIFALFSSVDPGYFILFYFILLLLFLWFLTELILPEIVVLFLSKFLPRCFAAKLLFFSKFSSYYIYIYIYFDDSYNVFKNAILIYIHSTTT